MFCLAVLLLCCMAPASNSELAERVVLALHMADLRIKLVDHLPDERWCLRTGCVSLSPIRVEIVRAFEVLRVERRGRLCRSHGLPRAAQLATAGRLRGGENIKPQIPLTL